MSGVNKIRYGLEQVHYAFIEGDGYETPTAVPGAVGLSTTPQGDSSTFHADNSEYFVVTTNDGYTGDLEQALFPDEFLAEALGWEIDENGMLVEVADGKPKPFALLGQVEGDSRNRRFVFYKCIAERPSNTDSTKAGNIDPATKTLPIKISPVTIDGRKIVKGDLELSDSNKTVFDAFFDAVLEPSFETAP